MNDNGRNRPYLGTPEVCLWTARSDLPALQRLRVSPQKLMEYAQRYGNVTSASLVLDGKATRGERREWRRAGFDIVRDVEAEPTETRRALVNEIILRRTIEHKPNLVILIVSGMTKAQFLPLLKYLQDAGLNTLVFATRKLHLGTVEEFPLLRMYVDDPAILVPSDTGRVQVKKRRVLDKIREEDACGADMIHDLLGAGRSSENYEDLRRAVVGINKIPEIFLTLLYILAQRSSDKRDDRVLTTRLRRTLRKAFLLRRAIYDQAVDVLLEENVFWRNPQDLLQVRYTLPPGDSLHQLARELWRSFETARPTYFMGRFLGALEIYSANPYDADPEAAEDATEYLRIRALMPSQRDAEYAQWGLFDPHRIEAFEQHAEDLIRGGPTVAGTQSASTERSHGLQTLAAGAAA